MTLKSCGGVPREISEKSTALSAAYRDAMSDVERAQLTLSIQEVAHGDSVVRAVLVDGSLLEHLIGVRLGSDAHVLLAKVLDMSVDVCGGQLLRERDLLQWKLVDPSARRAQQRRCGDNCAFHDCGW